MVIVPSCFLEHHCFHSAIEANYGTNGKHYLTELSDNPLIQLCMEPTLNSSELISWVHWNSVLMGYHKYYILMGWQGMVDAYIINIFSIQTHAPLFYEIASRKHKFEGKVIKKVRKVTSGY